MRIDNIDQLIKAYKENVINDKALIQILQEQTPQLAVWVDGDNKYSYSKADTLKGLHEYKQYLNQKSSYPIFFPDVADTSAGFCFNYVLNNGKEC